MAKNQAEIATKTPLESGLTGERRRQAEEIYAASERGESANEIARRLGISRAQVYKLKALLTAERDPDQPVEMKRRVTEAYLWQIVDAHYEDALDAKTGISKNKDIVLKALDMIARLTGQYPANLSEGQAPIQIAIVGGERVAANRPVTVKRLAE